MFQWLSCVLDFWSSSETFEEEYEFEDNEIDWESDVISQGFVEEMVRLNESEALEKLKLNNWDSKTTSLEILAGTELIHRKVLLNHSNIPIKHSWVAIVT